VLGTIFMNKGVKNMSVLVVDYGELNNLNSTATRLASLFQNKLDNYEGSVLGKQ